MNDYGSFLSDKAQLGGASGFKIHWMPEIAFDFQKWLMEWQVRMGRCAMFADCGLGKTPMELTFAQNILMQDGGKRPPIVLTPLAVSFQMMEEAAKFGIEAHRVTRGDLKKGVVNIINYEKLHTIDWKDVCGAVCDESSILKSFDGAMRSQITEFMRKLRYRLLATATAAPNDYTELGTSSEALGYLGHMDMLMRFFKNDQNTIRPMVYRQRGRNFAQLDERAKWRFKGHAEVPFWKWVCSWSRAIRKPSDIGFSDDGYILPKLFENQHVVKAERLADGFLFPMPAVGLDEQRDERRRTVRERCEKVAQLVNHKDSFVSWCHLNQEGDLLEDMIPDAVQVSGSDSDDAKEEKFVAFARGQVRGLITKPKIGAWGLNWQHCHRVVTFASHSYEQYYQQVRRCLRFGQKHDVTVDVVTTEGETNVVQNMQYKSERADRMFEALVRHMNESQSINHIKTYDVEETLPAWL